MACTVVETVTFISSISTFFNLAGGHSGDRHLSEQNQLCYISVYISQLKMLFTGVQSETELFTRKVVKRHPLLSLKVIHALLQW